METAVQGHVRVGLVDTPDYALALSDPLVGSSLNAVATWSKNRTNALPAGMDKFDIVLSLSAAKLYSVEVKCLDEPNASKETTVEIDETGESPVYV